MAPTIGDLVAQVRGAVIQPGDAAFERARGVYNAMHDRRPRVIVQAVDTADVTAALAYGVGHGLDIAVRGGAHSVPGFGTCDDGVVLDLSPMRWVRVDPARRTARVGGGTQWGDFDHAAHAHGLATTGGIISTTGVAGLTLGGGIGHLSRRCGLSCDNLLSADVVTAEGQVVTASDYQHEDLFWALRGGGGNFGVVTSMEFQLHPIGLVYGGPIFYEAADAGDVLRFYREFIATAPEELGAFFAWQIAPPLPFIPEDRHGDTMCAVVACWTGPVEEGEAMLRPLFDVAPVVAHHTGPLPYPALNGAFDDLLPSGLQHYWKADFVADLTDEAIAGHVEHGSRVPVVQSTMHLYPIDGAVQRVGATETAFAFRDVAFACVIAGMWPDPADNEAHIAWVRDYYAAIHPHSGVAGGYVNFMAGDDAGRVKDNYGPNHDRLTDVKAVYDPGNVFHLNQNIRPSV